MVRPSCCDKLNLKRGIWTAQEDAKILAYVSKHGTGNWTTVPKKTGLKRCGKSCRLRWTNYLKPDLKHDSFTPQEEEMIVRLHAAIGSRWSIIAQQLPGRTDNDVKSHWNTKLRKKLSGMGIDPVTHKPFSQILADYGNIGGLRKLGTRIGSLKKDFKNAIMLKSGPYPLSPPQGFPNINSQLMPSTTAPIHDTFLSNNQTNNPSFDLLAELQAIKLVTEAANCRNNTTLPPPIFVKDSLSSSSSSSPTCSTAVQEKSPLVLSWHDFLLDDAFLPAHPQEQEIMAEHSSKEFASQKHSLIPQNETNKKTAIEECIKAKGIDCEVLSNGFQPSSSSEISFVEAMLDQEYRMFLDFPNLLEEPFYY